jgi:hypothetical protein
MMREIDVVCVTIGMDQIVIDYCRPRRIEMHGGRMLTLTLSYIEVILLFSRVLSSLAKRMSRGDAFKKL